MIALKVIFTEFDLIAPVINMMENITMDVPLTYVKERINFIV